MKTGIERISEERQEKQIKKHGFTGKHHAENPQWYDQNQLVTAAAALINIEDWEKVSPLVKETYWRVVPQNWDKDWYNDLLGRPYEERLVISGAMLAAELDRRAYLKEIKKKKKPGKNAGKKRN